MWVFFFKKNLFYHFSPKLEGCNMQLHFEILARVYKMEVNKYPILRIPHRIFPRALCSSEGSVANGEEFLG